MIENHYRVAVSLHKTGTWGDAAGKGLAFLSAVGCRLGKHPETCMVGHAPISGQITASPVGPVFIISILNYAGYKVCVIKGDGVVVNAAWRPVHTCAIFWSQPYGIFYLLHFFPCKRGIRLFRIIVKPAFHPERQRFPDALPFFLW